jgi:hypothetical protein
MRRSRDACDRYESERETGRSRVGQATIFPPFTFRPTSRRGQDMAAAMACIHTTIET